MNKTIYFLITALIATKIFLILINPSFTGSKEIDHKIIWGKWSEEKINNLLETTHNTNPIDNKILLLSSAFLGTDYEENTLIGDNENAELLTINFEGMDCFTYLDYVESLRHSKNFNEFKKNLIHTRYKEQYVVYENRKHFFSDWLLNSNIVDVTNEVAENEAKTVTKELNQKSETELFLEGIPIVKREISYIPSQKIGTGIIENIKTGDYIGIYTDIAGLDVSHTGLFIKKNNKTYFRHASSKEKYRKVVDENFINYIKTKPGIVVYRKK